jgi:hypothetical protein
MADQATLKTNGPALVAGRQGANRAGAVASSSKENGAGPGDLVTNFFEFGENVLSLAELQARLGAIELKQNIEAIKIAGAVVLGGTILALAGLPIALGGIAELLVSELGMKRGFAWLSVAIATFAIAGVIVTLATSKLRRSAVGFPLSREEFARNLNWLRTVLVYSGRSARDRKS